MDITIKPLKPELLEDFLYFFDSIAFTDNPDWAKCYCHFYHFNGSPKEWVKTTAQVNRKASIELILSEKMHGYLAYSDINPIGWCNVNFKENFSKSILGKEIIDHSEGKIASIVCFIIAPHHRKQGIARKLLKTACYDFKSKNFDFIEAYPRKGKLTEALHYHGPLSLYKSEGFFIYKDFEKYLIVRKSLS
ncbi:MAG: GNAT family N-acetyltransferase [Candidatus Lokiarchaeota archaeon]|nr:GNAT family N-acetyltransferase [Candidatus Lokiarchaeota archaeon]